MATGIVQSDGRHMQPHDLDAEESLLGAMVVSPNAIPIATELPEKVNSILWIRKRKDTLAFGNITGAMVFQGTLLPAIGIFISKIDGTICRPF